MLFFALIINANGQNYINSKADKLVKGSKLVVVNEDSKAIEHIVFSPSANDQIRTQEGTSFLKNTLALPSDYGYQQSGAVSDQFGITESYQITYKGIPIEGFNYKIRREGKRMTSANGQYHFVHQSKSATSFLLSKEEAYNIALKFINAKKYQWEIDPLFTTPEGELLYLERGGELRLVYRFDMYSAEPLGRMYVYINSENGEIEKTEDLIHIYTNSTGTAVTKYQGTKTILTDQLEGHYRLRENSRGNGIETYDMNQGTSFGAAVDFTDEDNFWDNTANQDDAANDAHYGTAATYDYFYNTFGRNSIDGNGHVLKSYVHFSNGYVNAFWNGLWMTYGDGNNSGYSALTCIDIVAHEITHGLTQHSAGLVYSYESGALNESFSDIFGVVVDFYANPSTANYLMGDQLNSYGVPFRSIKNPNLYNNPDTYKGLYWYTGTGDNGGVHCNSGVQNFWFYLLCEGGSGTNDLGNTYSVESIGMEKAAAIAYRTLTAYLTPYSQYADARYYSIQAAIDLFGECSEEVISVSNAWHAVGVGEAFSELVVADFYPSQNFICNNLDSVHFSNLSLNGSEFLWDFGDDSVSTEKNPSHVYSEQGEYTVTLIAIGDSTCNGADTLIYPFPIIVKDFEGRNDVLCLPSTINLNGNSGIDHFSLAGLSNPSTGSSAGYQDFSCQYYFPLVEGQSYPYSISTKQNPNSLVKMWIDLNNDGIFNNSDELIFRNSRFGITKTGKAYIPKSDRYNLPLRLRIASDDNIADPLSDACTNSQYGQHEDYTVIIKQNNLPPLADFSISDSITGMG